MAGCFYELTRQYFGESLVEKYPATLVLSRLIRCLLNYTIALISSLYIHVISLLTTTAEICLYYRQLLKIKN